MGLINLSLPSSIGGAAGCSLAADLFAHRCYCTQCSGKAQTGPDKENICKKMSQNHIQSQCE